MALVYLRRKNPDYFKDGPTEIRREERSRSRERKRDAYNFCFFIQEFPQNFQGGEISKGKVS